MDDLSELRISSRSLQRCCGSIGAEWCTEVVGRFRLAAGARSYGCFGWSGIRGLDRLSVSLPRADRYAIWSLRLNSEFIFSLIFGMACFDLSCFDCLCWHLRDPLMILTCMTWVLCISVAMYLLCMCSPEEQEALMHCTLYVLPWILVQPCCIASCMCCPDLVRYKLYSGEVFYIFPLQYVSEAVSVGVVSVCMIFFQLILR